MSWKNETSKPAGSKNVNTPAMPIIAREISLFIFQDIIFLWIMKASIFINL
jgi:hypothetical protein